MLPYAVTDATSALSRARRRAARPGLVPLAEAFLHHRRGRHDVMFLKENAELLNIAECTGLGRTPALGKHYRAFHAEAPGFFAVFPQYYRFILSIVTDAEALGLPPGTGGRIAAEVAARGLAEAELSDLHRMEARRLCARHGVTVLKDDTTLEERVLRFVTRHQAFAVPNRKAAYDLTHFVFYFSEYGRRSPDLPGSVGKSLLNTGLIALLEEDIDLLSEVCIALRYMGRTPPPAWEAFIASELADFSVISEEPEDSGALSDDYHPFLVANWHQAVAGQPAFARAARPGRLVFRRRPAPRNTLVELSEILLALAQAGRLSVGALMEASAGLMSRRGRNVLASAASSTPQFDEFLAGFCYRGRGWRGSK
ncbi:hypothetical protein SAMN05444006_10532 [Allgaiera indica]|uniref:Uncharacterized protein n=1 Tax=Allgaiera indica TaxID=765699 RepID=A0A1H2US70_9RHOB|nr:hypothetical protein SAMN05444006_10532 [Allgaiera indica]